MPCERRRRAHLTVIHPRVVVSGALECQDPVRRLTVVGDLDPVVHGVGVGTHREQRGHVRHAQPRNLPGAAGMSEDDTTAAGGTGDVRR